MNTSRPRNIGKEIIRLKSLDYTYDEIVLQLKCSKSTVSYHCGEGQKVKTASRRKNRRAISHPFVSKTEWFKYTKNNRGYEYSKTIRSKRRCLYDRFFNFNRNVKTGERFMSEYTVEDVIAKFGESPTCYLTGDKIDIGKTRTYEFDHVIPRSKGGDNSLDNMGICTKEANQAKRDMCPDEFIFFCKKVLKHHGYKVEKEVTASELESESKI